MQKLVIKWIIAAGAIYAAGYILPGFNVTGAVAALSAAFLFGFLNFFLKPILTLLTLPVTVLTLGLFLFVINGIMVYVVSSFIPGIYVGGLMDAILASIVISIITMVFNSLLGVKDK